MCIVPPEEAVSSGFVVAGDHRTMAPISDVELRREAKTRERRGM